MKRNERLSFMKIMLKLLSGILSVVLVLSLCACGGGEGSSSENGDVVMSYGDFTLSESEYRYLASYVKDRIVYTQQNQLYYYTGNVYEESDILAMQISEDTTIADYIKKYSIELGQQMLIIESMCKEAGISITDESALTEISQNIADIEYAYGGEDLFAIALARLGFTKGGIERFERFSKLYDLIYDYRYGENGSTKIPAADVNKYFTENYFRYEGCIYSYVDSEGGKYVTFDFSDEEIKNQFYTDYVKVCHVLYKTVDDSGKKLDSDTVAEKKAKAEAALEAVTSGAKTMEDIKNETEDNGFEYTFTKGKMVKEFEDASFEMAVGETRLVETEYGYHVIHKLEMSDEQLFGREASEGVTAIKGVKDDVVRAMSQAKIYGEASALLEKLNNGELEKFPTELADVSYYSYQKEQFIDKNNSSYASMAEFISKIETGKVDIQNSKDSGAYLIKRLPFTESDITADVYSTIESNLSYDAFGEHIQSFYDSVIINVGALDKFDIVTLPALEEEFFQQKNS